MAIHKKLFGKVVLDFVNTRPLNEAYFQLIENMEAAFGFSKFPAPPPDEPLGMPLFGMKPWQWEPFLFIKLEFLLLNFIGPTGFNTCKCGLKDFPVTP